MLEARRLNAGYGAARVLFDVELAANRGEVVALLGRNGAGKSTTLKTLMGLIRPLSGEVHFELAYIFETSAWKLVKINVNVRGSGEEESD